MTRRVAVVLAACLAIAVVAAMQAPTASAQSTAISLSYDGEPIAAGEELLVEVDPDVSIQVAGEATIHGVILRVNGETVETYAPNATSFSRSYRPDLREGENTFRVIAETENGVESRTATLIKDDSGPYVRFTSPFETNHSRDVIPDNVTVNGSSVVLSGVLSDTTGVSSITISREFEFYHANVQHVAKDRWDVHDPSGDFSERIFLGNGTNTVAIRLEDDLGHVRDYSLEMNLTDTAAPEVDISVPNKTHRPTIEIDGEVRDDGQVDRVTVSVEGYQAPEQVFDGFDQEPDPSALTVPLSGSVRLQPGSNTVIVEATDLAGNTVTSNATVVYRDSVVPIVRFDREATRVEDGGLKLRGVVTGQGITGVTVESVAVESEEVVDLVRVYHGSEVRNEVSFEETLSLPAEMTRINVRAMDESGEEHVTFVLVDPASGNFAWQGSEAIAETEGNATTTNVTPTAANNSTTPANATETPAPTATSTPTGTTVAEEGLPGFTAAVAATALLLAALVAARRRQ